MKAERVCIARLALSAPRSRRFTHALALAAVLALAFEGGAGRVVSETAPQHIDPATGYRIEHYQAAVPETPPAGERVWIDVIDRLLTQERALLIDVSPITGAGYDPHTGAWRYIKPHLTLPGAVWLPEVGRGVIDANVTTFLQNQLKRLTGGDTAHAIIIFCSADCWMSWNAMKRIAALGYTRLYWFPEGTDGWRDWERPLVPANPVPIDLTAAGKR